MRKIPLFSVSLLIFLSVPGFAADKPAPAARAIASQRELPAETLEWMSERYDAKTLLGLKWKNLDKGKLFLSLNRMQAYPGAAATPFFARKAGGLNEAGEPAAHPSVRLDLSPAVLQKSFYTDIESDTYDFKVTGLGGAVGWNAGYAKVSETEDYSSWSGGTYETKGDVLFASLVLSPPAGDFAPYLYAGPARIKYDYSETTTNTTFLGVPPWWVTTTSSLSKSETVYTWIFGIGAAYTLPGGNVGFFVEYKHLPEVNYFKGVDNLGLGLSLSI